MDTICNSEPALSKLIGDLREAWRLHKYLKVKWTTGKKRSLDQNSLSHVWYAQIAEELREDTPLAIKNECKLLYGCPILCAEDDDFRWFFDMAISPLSHEDRVRAMSQVDVTSLMDKAQLSEYLWAMQDGYRGRVALTFPGELEAA